MASVFSQAPNFLSSSHVGSLKLPVRYTSLSLPNTLIGAANALWWLLTGPLDGCTSAFFFKSKDFRKCRSLCWLIKTMHDAYLSELWGSGGFILQKPQIPLSGIPATQAVHNTLTEIIILSFIPTDECVPSYIHTNMLVN